MYSKKTQARHMGITSKRKEKRIHGSAGDSHGTKPAFYDTSCTECGWRNKVSIDQDHFICANCHKYVHKPLTSGGY